MSSFNLDFLSGRFLVVIGGIAIILTAWGLLFDVEIKVKPSRLVSGVKTFKDPAEIKTTGTSNTSVEGASTYPQLAAEVVPLQGKRVEAVWGDMGSRLVEAGAIDLNKFETRYKGLGAEQKRILQGDDLDQITFTPQNIQFWTNVLWSLGLTQKSKVLSEGPMQENVERTPIERYASTAGWTLGSKPAMELFNSTNLVVLTPEQDERVFKVAENIYRPCCGNSTAYPDCNHGMAVLGLLELMASQGASEEEMYRAALVFNTYAFPSTYVTLAAYLEKQGISWDELDPKEALGKTYSSGLGARTLAREVGQIPGTPKQGGSCGV